MCCYVWTHENMITGVTVAVVAVTIVPLAPLPCSPFLSKHRTHRTRVLRYYHTRTSFRVHVHARRKLDRPRLPGGGPRPSPGLVLLAPEVVPDGSSYHQRTEACVVQHSASFPNIAGLRHTSYVHDMCVSRGMYARTHSVGAGPGAGPGAGGVNCLTSPPGCIASPSAKLCETSQTSARPN